jgi:hypothetical protein
MGRVSRPCCATTICWSDRPPITKFCRGRVSRPRSATTIRYHFGKYGLGRISTGPFCRGRVSRPRCATTIRYHFGKYGLGRISTGPFCGGRVSRPRCATTIVPIWGNIKWAAYQFTKFCRGRVSRPHCATRIGPIWGNIKWAAYQFTKFCRGRVSRPHCASTIRYHSGKYGLGRGAQWAGRPRPYRDGNIVGAGFPDPVAAGRSAGTIVPQSPNLHGPRINFPQSPNLIGAGGAMGGETSPLQEWRNCRGRVSRPRRWNALGNMGAIGDGGCGVGLRADWMILWAGMRFVG